jgi:hypothetical protein
MVVWLEDMKIRFYPIDARQTLRDIQNPQWEQSLIKVIYLYNHICISFVFCSFYKI